ncbi:site-specific DNA-methyltransferase [Treponema bryantii]|uniref:site-specific DNA-methyltransferase n=1 Tax=Treponema bryantii TaxID=163 RepID=UPI002B298453|nr:hypothetical protein TRBR_29210 [Treponema bryantii]
MPTLDWIGKKKVVNHHLEVPFKVLKKSYTYSADGKAKDSENKIIHGDNLEALKSLLPEYEGRIDCIYIDPPYNTGNEGWIYNDNVNDPRIKKWLGEVVGKESEDFTRHDKWLCMMYPRLKLLHKLLNEKGAIFISIDDNEQANLKLICDEIFGSGNFVANISWQRTYSIRNDSKGIPSEVEHIIVYSKTPEWQPNPLPRTAEMDKAYKNPDNDENGAWMSGSPVAPAASTHQGMVYAIQHPFTGEMIYPSDTACWRYQQDAMLEYMNGWCDYKLEDLHDEEERAKVCGIPSDKIRKNVKAIVLAKSLEESKKQAKKVYDRGNWPRFYFTNNGKGGIRRKVYLEGAGGRITTNFYSFEECGHTDEAKKEIKSIFGGSAPFDTPKPTRLIERILQIATNKDSVILDSFAGSATTAHTILNMNNKDNGNRKFIIIEMMDYADSITAERVKRVIKGYNDIQGTGGDFSFYELGEPLLINGLLNENVDTGKIREYVWFTETHSKLQHEKTKDNEYFLGKHNEAGYWFFYKKNEETCLNYDFLSTMKTKVDQYIIYADVCRLPDNFLKEHNIIFKKIPREIQKF